MYIIITSLIIFIILSSFLLYDMINIHDIYRSYSVNIINNNSKIQNRIQNRIKNSTQKNQCKQPVPYSSSAGLSTHSSSLHFTPI